MIPGPLKTQFSHKAPLLLASLLFIAQAALYVAPASAQQDIVDERQKGFKALGGAMKTLRNELKGGEPDSAKISKAAEEMANLSAKIPHWFPKGSGPDSGIDTDALAYIWKNNEKFTRISNDLISDTKAMVPLAAGTDYSAVKKQLMKVKDNCSSCHDSFRAD